MESYAQFKTEILNIYYKQIAFHGQLRYMYNLSFVISPVVMNIDKTISLTWK